MYAIDKNSPEELKYLMFFFSSLWSGDKSAVLTFTIQYTKFPKFDGNWGVE